MNVKKVACWDEGLRRVLEGQRVENPYALIDALTYGFEGDNVACWEVFDESRLEAVVYRYYDGLQVVFCGQAGHRAIRAVATLVEKMDPSMVQTSYSAAAELATVLADYSLSEGWVMRADGTQVPDPAAVRATEADYPEIARLICGDEEIGKHYDVSALVAQLCERERLQGCRSIVIRDREGIAAHMATYAESDDVAVCAGLKARPGAEKGVGARVLSSLAVEVAARGLIPLLYCYIEPLWPWYEAQGWEKAFHVAKLEHCGNY